MPGLNVLELLALIEGIAADPNLAEALRGMITLPENGRAALSNLVRLHAETSRAAEGRRTGSRKRR